MKLSVIVIFTTAIALFQNIRLTEAGEYEAVFSDCVAREGATQHDIEMFGMENPTTKSGKCLDACIVEKYELMKNNKLVYDAVIETVKSEISDDPDSLKLASEIVGECVDVTDEDRCEASYKILLCLENAAKSRGIEWDR